MKRYNVIFVDDEENILSAIKRLLRNHPTINVLTFSNAKEALERLKEKEISLIVADYNMPEMNGTELLRRVKEMHPKILRMMLTGSADMSDIVSAINEGGVYHVIIKPWNKEDLILTLEKGLEYLELKNKNEKMNHKLQEYSRSLEKHIVARNRSLKKAQKVQKSLNTKYLPSFKNVNIAALYMPWEELGGDYFDVRQIEDKMIIIMADCTGHGLESSMDAAFLKAISDKHFTLLTEEESPGYFLSSINKDLYSYSFSHNYPTMFAAILYDDTKKIKYASAAAPMPFIINNDYVHELEFVEGFLLGYMEEYCYEEKEYVMKENDIFFSYSDAVSDIYLSNEKYQKEAEEDSFFGKKMLTDRLKDFGHSGKKDVNHLIKALKDDFGLPLEDDTTALHIEFLKDFKCRIDFSNKEEVEKILKITKDALKRRDYAKEDFLIFEKSFNYIKEKMRESISNVIDVRVDCESVLISMEDFPFSLTEERIKEEEPSLYSYDGEKTYCEIKKKRNETKFIYVKDKIFDKDFESSFSEQEGFIF